MNINQRASQLEVGKIYFWTATIHNWINLLEPDFLKDLVISSLQYLSRTEKIEVYGFVIMPNHIHLIWQILMMNGKEMPNTSFLKFTAHSFEKYLKENSPEKLDLFAVKTKNKKFEFWKRDSFPFELLNVATISQKLDYIHHNPLAGKWMLAKEPEEYYYSSAKFYETGIDDFNFLVHIGDAI